MTPESIIDPVTYEFTMKWMSIGDLSHDFKHILRVYGNAMKILQRELQAHPEQKYDRKVIAYGAFLHDIGDRKYFPIDTLDPPRDYELIKPKYFAILENYGLENATFSTVVQRFLEKSCGPEFAEKVQIICNNVSWSNEKEHQSEVLEVLERHPELGIVQDADRLDAIGGLGLFRVSIYTAVKLPGRGVKGTLEHIDEKLLHISKWMKTETGKREAGPRTEMLKRFLDGAKEELAFGSFR